MITVKTTNTEFQPIQITLDKLKDVEGLLDALNRVYRTGFFEGHPHHPVLSLRYELAKILNRDISD